MSVNPNQLHKVTMGGVELYLSEAQDVIHHYAPLDAYWLNYIDPNEDNDQRMFVLKEVGARWVLDNTPVPCVERKTIMQSEYEALVDVLSQWVLGSLLDFEPEASEEGPDDSDWSRPPGSVDDTGDNGPLGL